MSDSESEENRTSEDLREFVYLNPLSVKSLLASLDVSIPESMEEVAEESQANQRSVMATAGLPLPNLFEIRASGESSSSNEEREQKRTTYRINDQYLFSILQDELGDRVYDVNSDTDDEEPEPGDVVKIRGRLTTDPLFRILGIVSLLEDEDTDHRFSSFNQMKFEESRKQLYNGRIGLKADPVDGEKIVGMVVNEEHLWVDARREFLGPQEYTVLGRKIHSLSSDDEWNFLDLFRVLSEGSGKDDLSEIRENFIRGFVNNNKLTIDMSERIVEQAFFQKLMTGSVNSKEIEEMKSAVEKFREDLDADDEQRSWISLLYELYRKDESEDEDFAHIDLTEIIGEEEIEEEFTLQDADIISPIAIYW